MSGRRRLRMHAVGIVVLVTVLASLGAPALQAATPAPASVDPFLLSQIASRGLAPAILTWDRAEADRAEVASYLEEHGIEANVLDGLSVAFACAGPTNLDILAGAPGAISVWGDHPLEPALDKSVRTAFGGDPNAVWQGDGITGKGVAIAVVDTGLDATHPDLEYDRKTKLNVRVISSRHDITGPYADPPCGVPDAYTDQMRDSELTSGHGTHLAGVAAGDGTVSGGRYKGVAPGAELVGVGVTDTVTPQTSACLSTDPCSIEGRTYLSLLGAVAGMYYALNTGLEGCNPPLCQQPRMVRTKVIIAGWTQDGLYDPLHPMNSIVNDLAWYGINVVFPVGNEGSEKSDCSKAETCHFNPLAAGSSAIGVAATPKDSRTAIEPYSSGGDPTPRETRGVTALYEPTLAAPGTGVVSARRPGAAPLAQPPGSILGAGPTHSPGTERRYVAMTGTSVAAAHVAGAIALMQQAAVEASGCFLTSEQVIDILRSTADPIPGAASWQAGAGALDVPAATRAASVGGPPSIDSWMCPQAA